MEIKIIKDESKELAIEFQTHDLTIPDLIANELLNDDNVEFAGVSKDHPETGKPVLVVRSKRSAKSDLLRALKSIDENFAELKGQLSKKK